MPLPRQNTSRWLPLMAAVALTGCVPSLYPGPMAREDVDFAKAFYAAEAAGRAQPVSRLPLDRLFAVHRYGLSRVHPSRGMNAEFARRGAAAVPFLAAKLERRPSWGEAGSVLEALKAMQDTGTYDARRDPALAATIDRVGSGYPDDPNATLRNLADELVTGTRIPTWYQPYYRTARLGGVLHEGHGRDYDHEFAQRYCRTCSYRQFTAGLDERPLDQLYALQRYGAEKLVTGYNIDHVAARRGAAAAAFYKAKLAEGGNEIMVWTVLSTLEVMRDLGTYDVTADAALMQLAERAAVRADPGAGPLSHIVARLKTGERFRTLPAHPMG